MKKIILILVVFYFLFFTNVYAQGNKTKNKVKNKIDTIKVVRGDTTLLIIQNTETVTTKIAKPKKIKETVVAPPKEKRLKEKDLIVKTPRGKKPNEPKVKQSKDKEMLSQKVPRGWKIDKNKQPKFQEGENMLFYKNFLVRGKMKKKDRKWLLDNF